MSWRPPEPDPYVELTDQASLREAIASREEERSRRDRAVDVATWEGTLRDLAERRARLVVHTAGDRTHRGSLIAVGIDHVAIRLANGTTVLVASDTVRSVRPEPGSVANVATGDRERSQDRTLVEALGRIAEERPTVVVALRDLTDALTGTIIGLGEDIISLRVEGFDASVVYVPAPALREVIVPG